jgi:hypothetical protein
MQNGSASADQPNQRSKRLRCSRGRPGGLPLGGEAGPTGPPEPIREMSAVKKSAAFPDFCKPRPLPRSRARWTYNVVEARQKGRSSVAARGDRAVVATTNVRVTGRRVSPRFCKGLRGALTAKSRLGVGSRWPEQTEGQGAPVPSCPVGARGRSSRALTK